MIGVLWNIALSDRANRKFAARYRDLEPADEKLGKRLAHWQQRLELKHDVRLGFGPTARPLSYGVIRSVIVLPRAIAHWPLSIQDVMLLGALAHIKRRNLVWLVIGQFVSALYWPIPWVRVLVANFNGAFEHTSDSMAASCYQDRLGYLRGLKHADQRLELIHPISASRHISVGEMVERSMIGSGIWKATCGTRPMIGYFGRCFLRSCW